MKNYEKSMEVYELMSNMIMFRWFLKVFEGGARPQKKGSGSRHQGCMRILIKA